MRILITGGAGFIGSNLANELSKEHQVVVIDNLFLGSYDNLNANVIKITGDCGDNLFKKLPEKYDVIFHFGNYSSAPMYHTDTEQRISKTISDFVHVLEFAAKNNAKLIYSSTSSIYGPSTYYTSVKECYEKLAKAYFNERKVNSVGFRLFSVYGPKEEYKKGYANMITQMAWKMLRGERPNNLFHEGKPTRDFVYVDDIVKSLITAMNEKNQGAFVHDVGTGKAYSFNECIDLINKELKTDIKPIYKESIPNFVHDTLCKKSYIQPKIELESGVKKLIDYYKNKTNPCLQ